MKVFSGLLVALFFIVGTSASAQGHAKLAGALEQIRDANQVPALGALVYQDGSVHDVAVVGVRIWGESTRVTETDPFHLGSDTKAMTATLVALMIDRGLFKWTSTLGELLPDITTMDAAYRSVTVEMLLAHRAGLGSEFEFDGGTLMRRVQYADFDPAEGDACSRERCSRSRRNSIHGPAISTAMRVMRSRAGSSNA